MSGLDISFTPRSRRINIQTWYNLAGPDGTIDRANADDKDLRPFEQQVHGKILSADIESKLSTLRKKRFTTPFSYTYSRYLELREVLAKDHISVTENEMARLKLDPRIFIKFYESTGTIMSAMLDGDQVYHGIKLKGGTSIMLSPDGEISFGILAEDQPIKVGKATLIGKADSEISFHSNGVLQQITIASPYTIRWIDPQPQPIKHATTCGPDSVIIYYDNGNPRSFDSVDLNGHVYLLENGEFDDYSAH